MMNTVLIVIVVVLVLFLMGKKLHKQGFFRKKESNGNVECSCESTLSGRYPEPTALDTIGPSKPKPLEKEVEVQLIEDPPMSKLGESFSYFTPNSLLPKATDIPVLKEEIKIAPLLHQKKKDGRKKKVKGGKNAKTNVL